MLLCMDLSCATGSTENGNGSPSDSSTGITEAGDGREEGDTAREGSADAGESEAVDLTGHACTVDSECGADQACFYLVAAGCTATGVCEDLPPGPACYGESQCPGCDGGTVCIGCPGTPCSAPSGYARAPVPADSGCSW